MFEVQATLFSSLPNRLALLSLDLPIPDGKRIDVNVWRNHAFEPLEPLASPYFAFSSWPVRFRLGPYDDSFSFNDRRTAAAELVWLDSRRLLLSMEFDEWLVWLEERLRYLRSVSEAPIIIATWLEGEEMQRRLQLLADALPAVFFADLGGVCSAAGTPLLDERSASLAGTSLSKNAQLLLARELACHWLPGALLPPVKAIALDLDNTLHAGVLGEDGIHGVQLTPGHSELQQCIKTLKERGVFIGLVSRNDQHDVEALFSQRGDYPLHWEDFSITEISWGDKASALERMAKALRIAPDAMLFVDDNPGELANVAQHLPQVHAIYAHPDASLTCRAIQYYPALWRWKVTGEDVKRQRDLMVSTERDALAERIRDPAEYFRALQVTLTYRHAPWEQLNRLADLCNKTNQFNLAMSRFNQVEIAKRLHRPNACVASVRLTDRLSDSGIIAVIVAERNDDTLLVEELCISCRAMGRQLEDTIVLSALRQMPIYCGCRQVAFRVQHGPRNRPALDWLTKLLNLPDTPAAGIHVISIDRLRLLEPAAGVTLIQQ